MEAEFIEKSCIPNSCSECPFMTVIVSKATHAITCGYYDLVENIPEADFSKFIKPDFCKVRQIKVMEEV